MRNSHVMLLVVLGLLLARQGVEGENQCYDCPSCPEVDSSTRTKDCAGSCLATVTCQDDGEHYVARVCSRTNEADGCVESDSIANTYSCYCNEDNCDALADSPDICDSAVSSVASLALVLVTLLPGLLLR